MASGSRTLRQRWSDAFKKRIVAEASEPGVTVSEIARRYDLDARRVSNWMKKFDSGVALVPVEVTSGDSDSPTSPAIEVDLPCGTRVRCGQETSAELVTSVFSNACSTWLCVDSKYRNVAQWKRTPTLKRSE